MLQETFSGSNKSRNHCLLYLLCEYTYLHINILQKFCKIFSNVSFQSFKNLLNVDLMQWEWCPIEFLFCKACWEKLVPHSPSHRWRKVLIIGKERQVRVKGGYRWSTRGFYQQEDHPEVVRLTSVLSFFDLNSNGSLSNCNHEEQTIL